MKNSLRTFIGLVLVLGIFGTAYAGIPAHEREALIALYDSTDGDNWTNNTNWLGPEGTECDWYGVGCDYDTVKYIYLSDNNLNGNIPPELRQLYSIHGLTLSLNQLTGAIPRELGHLPFIKTLDLWGNHLSGSIPPELGDPISDLETLDLRHNQLTGNIPPELGNLSKLKYLYLWHNQLTGNIPLELTNLSNLENLSLSENQLTGSIPPELTNLSNLQGLGLSYNQLTGSIPPELGNLSKLKYLDFWHNQLTGNVPLELTNLSNLENLDLSYNQLTGNIPPELGNLSNLRTLNLSDNHLTGGIPSEIGNMSQNLYLLVLKANALVGEVPSELKNLIYIQGGNLDIRWNGLYTFDDSLRAFLNSKQINLDWEGTQTIAPTDLRIGVQTADSIELLWRGIVFIGGPGGYEISYATTPDGPYTVYGVTANKEVQNAIVRWLSPDTTYYFRLRTITYNYELNDNTIFSEYTSLISGTTLPLPSGVKWVAYTGIITNSSPAVRADGTIYVGSYEYGALFAINPDGSPKWGRPTGIEVYSSPALSESGRTVYLHSGYTLYAVDADTGDPIWTFDVGDMPVGSPAIGRDGTIYVGSWNKLYAINPNGSESWHYLLGPLSDRVINSPVVGHDGTIYIGTENSSFYAINPDGTLKRMHPGAVLNSSPAIGYDGTIYVKASPLDERTRDLLVAFNPDTLEVEWFVELSSTGHTYSSPAIGPDGTIYVGAAHNLYAVNPNGTLKWTIPTGGRVFSSPVVGSDGSIYVGSEDKNIYETNPDGSLMQVIPTGEPVYSSPAIEPGGLVYIGSEDGHLYAIFGSSNGLASSAWPMLGHELHHTGRAGHAQLILDRANVVFADTTFGCGIPTSGNLYQSFIPSAPVLAGVDLRLRVGGGFPNNGYTTAIRIRSDSPAGQVLGTASTFITGPKDTGTELVVSFDFIPEIILTPGNTYVIEWISPSEGGVVLTWFASNYDSYPGGTAFGCQGAPMADRDFIFKTYEVKNTSAGGNIAVQPIDPTTLKTPVTVTFDKVIMGGATFMSTSQTGSPPPPGYKPGLPSTYYDLSTTAGFSGSVKVCIDYSGIQFNQEGRIKLFHNQNDTWVDITSSLDTGSDMICGLSQSLSPFAIFELSYNFIGFSPPVKNSPTVNTAQAGRTVPLKWQLVDGGGRYISDLKAVASIGYHQVSCDSYDNTMVNPVEVTETSEISGLHYDSTENQYIYNWKSDKTMTGKCYMLTLTLYALDKYQAIFKMK